MSYSDRSYFMALTDVDMYDVGIENTSATWMLLDDVSVQACMDGPP